MRLQHRIKTKPNPPCNKKIYISRLIFIEMSIDVLFCWWHQRANCHIFCRWDWAATRGLVANTIEECKHTEVHESPINGCSLGLINYPKKETEVWGHRRNLIRTRFITQSLYHHPTPHTVFSFRFFLNKSVLVSTFNDSGVSGESRDNSYY